MTEAQRLDALKDTPEARAAAIARPAAGWLKVDHMFDSDTAPDASHLAAARRSGIRVWAGYLDSPVFNHGWTTAHHRLVLDEAMGSLPIYGMPLNEADRRSHPAKDAAESTVEQLHALGDVTQLVACLDVEERAYESGPASCIAWAAEYFDELRAHHVRPVQYANAPALAAQHRQGTDHRAAAAWVASWVTSLPKSLEHVTGFPDDLWAEPQRRAWQWRGNASFQGVGVDLSVIEPEFVAMHRSHHKPPPKPAPKEHPHLTVTGHGGRSVTLQGPITVEAKAS